jgi:hypothetical protein
VGHSLPVSLHRVHRVRGAALHRLFWHHGRFERPVHERLDRQPPPEEASFPDDFTRHFWGSARRLVERLAILEMVPNVLARALEPFPAPVRTLDALHLASIEFLRERGQAIELASYDERLIVAAREIGIPIVPL